MWRAVVALLLLLSLGSGGLAGLLEDSLGSPGELAWQAWLLVDSRGPPTQRRITPKSVFIAPAFTPQALPACADGYQADAMGRCVKLVRVNQAAQLDFLLKRLNFMYAAPSVQDTAPLKVHLPIASATLSQDAPNPEAVASPEISVVMADVKRSSNNDSSEEDKDGSSEPVVSVWSIKNNSVSNKDSTPLEIPIEAEPVTEVEDPSHKLAVFKVPPPPTEVLAPTDVQDSLPMLVLSPQSSFSSLQQNSFEVSSQDQSETADIASNVSSTTHEQRPGIPGNHSVGISLRLGSIHLDKNNTQNISGDSSLNTNNSELRPSGEFVQSVNSTSEMNGQEPAKVNETSDDADTTTKRDGLVPHSVKRKQSVDDLYTSEVVHPQGFIRFPEESVDSSKQADGVNLFKGSYVKFPSEDKFHNKPLSETLLPFPYHKQTFWWLPTGWHLDQQRHQPTLLRFWSRMPLQTDPSLVTRYSSSYGEQSSGKYKREQPKH